MIRTQARKVRVTRQKSELQTKSQSYSRADPQNPNRIAQKRPPNRVWVLLQKTPLKPSWIQLTLSIFREFLKNWKFLKFLVGGVTVTGVSKISNYCQRCAPAEWNLREIFRFSHRFWREILVKFYVAHPNPGKRSTENFTKISRQISRHLWQRKTERKFSLPHFCRAAALTIAPLLLGSLSDDMLVKVTIFFVLRFVAMSRGITLRDVC